MANYPQLDDQVGVWKLKEVNDVVGGYWRSQVREQLWVVVRCSTKIEKIQLLNVATLGNATDFGDLNNNTNHIGGVEIKQGCTWSGGNTFLCYHK